MFDRPNTVLMQAMSASDSCQITYHNQMSKHHLLLLFQLTIDEQHFVKRRTGTGPSNTTPDSVIVNGLLVAACYLHTHGRAQN